MGDASRFVRGKQVAFSELEALVDGFEELLREHGIAIRCGSKLDDIALSVSKYLALNRGELVLPPTTDLRDEEAAFLEVCSPSSSTRGNGGSEPERPDVKPGSSESQALACRVLQSDKPERYRDQVLKGIQQIYRCALDLGVVVINVKNLLPLEMLMPFGTILVPLACV